jgi:uncharacterized protein YjbI with pentapeptide repeats
VTKVLKLIGVRTYAYVYEADVSEKPPTWSGKGNDDEIRLVKGARLNERNLNFIIASRAFLVNAELSDAALLYATLPRAELMGADLRRAKDLTLEQIKEKYPHLLEKPESEK